MFVVLYREKQVELGMSNMPKYIAEFKAKRAKGREEMAQANMKQRALLEEARDYYGYEIERNDPRFKLMIEKKAEEAKLAKKMKKRENREAHVIELMKEVLKKDKTPSNQDK